MQQRAHISFASPLAPCLCLRLLRRAIDARASSPLHAFPAADSLNFNDDEGVD